MHKAGILYEVFHFPHGIEGRGGPVGRHSAPDRRESLRRNS